MIFSRKRGNAGKHIAEDNGRSKGRHVRGRDDGDLLDDAELDDVDTEADTAPAHGPYDVTEAPNDKQERLDLGALRIPAIAGVEIQLQAGADGQVEQVLLVAGESRMQLGVFAAPRSEGIWAELRGNLRTTLAQTGARQEDVTGEYGPELKARIRDGSSTVDVRHIGIDGPRWFVHAVFIGAAAADPEQAGPLGEVLRGLVVDRGTEARPVSEALPLRLPPQAAAQLAAAAQSEAAQSEAAQSEAAQSEADAATKADEAPRKAPTKSPVKAPAKTTTSGNSRGAGRRA